MKRPNFEDITSGAEFNTWYWLKAEMVEICKQAYLPSNGSKFELRDSIMFALDHKGQIQPVPKKKKSKSKFNWAKEILTLDTKITDNVSFGPNFRRFMKHHIGTKFSCHSDFMDWVKDNEGKTLEDAVQIYYQLEKRRENPSFERKIADNNMLAQYTRDFMKDNPGKSLENVRKYWLLKKQLPMKNGFVIYEKSDLDLGKK